MLRDKAKNCPEIFDYDVGILFVWTMQYIKLAFICLQFISMALLCCWPFIAGPVQEGIICIGEFRYGQNKDIWFLTWQKLWYLAFQLLYAILQLNIK